MVQGIGVVPQDFEIFGGRLQGGQPVDCFVRIDHACGVGVFRDTPDAANIAVAGNKLFHRIHVRAGICHRQGDHVDAKLLADSEMPVIAGNRAQD